MPAILRPPWSLPLSSRSIILAGRARRATGSARRSSITSRSSFPIPNAAWQMEPSTRGPNPDTRRDAAPPRLCRIRCGVDTSKPWRQAQGGTPAGDALRKEGALSRHLSLSQGIGGEAIQAVHQGLPPPVSARPDLFSVRGHASQSGRSRRPGGGRNDRFGSGAVGRRHLRMARGAHSPAVRAGGRPAGPRPARRRDWSSCGTSDSDISPWSVRLALCRRRGATHRPRQRARIAPG